MVFFFLIYNSCQFSSSPNNPKTEIKTQNKQLISYINILKRFVLITSGRLFFSLFHSLIRSSSVSKYLEVRAVRLHLIPLLGVQWFTPQKSFLLQDADFSFCFFKLQVISFFCLARQRVTVLETTLEKNHFSP